jgi:ribonuclease HI
MEAEAWALREAITWLVEAGLSRVVIELDCMLVVNAITDMSINNSEFGCIINSCKQLLRNYPNFEISFLKRQANFVAHLLVRSSKSYTCSQTLDYSPSCITTTLMNEII